MSETWTMADRRGQARRMRRSGLTVPQRVRALARVSAEVRGDPRYQGRTYVGMIGWTWQDELAYRRSAAGRLMYATRPDGGAL